MAPRSCADLRELPLVDVMSADEPEKEPLVERRGVAALWNGFELSMRIRPCARLGTRYTLHHRARSYRARVTSTCFHNTVQTCARK